jgi:hypothetical protein
MNNVAIKENAARSIGGISRRNGRPVLLAQNPAPGCDEHCSLGFKGFHQCLLGRLFGPAAAGFFLLE